MKELASKLITKEIVNLKLAKFILNYNCRTAHQRVGGRQP